MCMVKRDQKFQKNNNKRVRATFGLILNPRYVCNPEKGAAITFTFSYVNPYLLPLCPVIMKTANLATVLRHGCSRVLNTFPRHNRVPEPVSNLWFTCQKNIGPFSKQKNIKIYFRIFIGILKPV